MPQRSRATITWLVLVCTFMLQPCSTAEHSRVRCALAFWGLTRTLNMTIDSIRTNIFDSLKQQGVSYSVFLHTYMVGTAAAARACGGCGCAFTRPKMSLRHNMANLILVSPNLHTSPSPRSFASCPASPHLPSSLGRMRTHATM